MLEDSMLNTLEPTVRQSVSDWLEAIDSKHLILQVPISAAMRMSILYSLAFFTIPDAGSIHVQYGF